MPPKEQYGLEDDVQITLEGSTFGATSQGRVQKAVVVSRAAPDASAPTNEAIPINTRIDTASEFGQSSPLAEQLQAASKDGATISIEDDLLYGVAPAETSHTDEQVPGGSGELANAPIVANQSDVVVTTTDDAGTPDDPSDDTTTEYTVNFVYESLPTAPSGSDNVVNLNPVTGEFEGPTSDDYSVSYKSLDWEGAIDAAATAIGIDEVGVIGIDTTSNVVSSYLSDTLDRIRTPYRLGVGVTISQPNATNNAGEPIIDVQDFSDTLDNAALFSFSGGTLRAKPPTEGSEPRPLTTPIGGLVGAAASNELTESIWNDVLTAYDGYELTQEFDGTEIQSLRDKQTIPLRAASRNEEGQMQIRGNHSTSTASDWVRDLHRRQLNDVVLLNVRDVGQDAESEFQTVSNLDEVKQQVIDRFKQLASDGVILSAANERRQTSEGGVTATGATPATAASNIGTPAGEDGDGEDDRQYYAVEVVRSSLETIEIRYAYVPTPIIKHVEGKGVVYDELPEPQTGSTTVNA